VMRITDLLYEAVEEDEASNEHVVQYTVLQPHHTINDIEL